MSNGRLITFKIYRLRQKFGAFWPLVAGFAFLFLLFLAGILIYMTVEGWSLLDSFYMVVIALSTVGFQEVHPLSDYGRVWTSAMILMGVGTFAYLIGSFTQILVDGRLQLILGRRRIQKMIKGLNNHFIICGFGRIGSVVANEIRRENFPVVVIEKDHAAIQELQKQDFLYIEGDATDEDVLISAGLEKAKTLITTLSLEAENVYVTLTAKQIRPELCIVARADSQQAIRKLERAGAERVIMPHVIGGLRMAQLVLRPTVINFLELAMRGEHLDLQMEELLVKPGSELVDKDLLSSKIRPRFELIIIAIKKEDGQMIFNPQPQTVINANDTLIAVGTRENLTKFEKIL